MGLRTFWKYGMVLKSLQGRENGLEGIGLWDGNLPVFTYCQQDNRRSYWRGRRVFFCYYRYLFGRMEKCAVILWRGDILRILLYGNYGMEYGKMRRCKEKNSSVSALPSADRDMAGDCVMRLSASYTIEAAYVMAVVLIALVTMILGAYHIHDETAGAMAVQEAVEKSSYLEEVWTGKENDEIRKVYLKDSYHVQVKQNGKNITGIGTGMRWSLEIQRKKYEPEGFLRLISIVQEGLLNSRK